MAIGEVRIELGGRDRELRFRLRAWSALEDQGFSLDDMLERMRGGGFNLKALQVLLWAMLRHESPAPSLDEVGDWVGGDNVEMVTAKLGEAIKGAFPADPPPVAAPVGSGTGPEPAP